MHAVRGRNRVAVERDVSQYIVPEQQSNGHRVVPKGHSLKHANSSACRFIVLPRRMPRCTIRRTSDAFYITTFNNVEIVMKKSDKYNLKVIILFIHPSSISYYNN